MTFQVCPQRSGDVEMVNRRRTAKCQREELVDGLNVPEHAALRHVSVYRRAM